MSFFISVFQWFTFYMPTNFLEQIKSEKTRDLDSSSEITWEAELDCHYNGNPSWYKILKCDSGNGSNKEGMITSHVQEGSLGGGRWG